MPRLCSRVASRCSRCPARSSGVCWGSASLLRCQSRWRSPWASSVCSRMAELQLFSRGPARVPQRSWQVPRSWVEERGPLGRMAVWAVTLGHGLMTRNPYVSFWVVVPALGSARRIADAAVIGAVAGAVHGVARLGGIVARQRSRPGTDWNLLAVLWHMRFIRLDGALLLATGTGAVIALVLAVG